MIRCIVRFLDGSSDGLYCDEEKVFSQKDFLIFSTDTQGRFPVFIQRVAIIKVTAVTQKQFKEFMDFQERLASQPHNHDGHEHSHDLSGQ